jgi:AcrR family transcriptional regulator
MTSDDAESTARGTYARLLEAINDCVHSLDVDDLSSITVEDVAQRAGVSRATAYRHLGSSDEVLYQAALALHGDLTSRIQAALEPLPSFAERLEEAFAYTARIVRADAGIGLLMRSERRAPLTRALRDMASAVFAPSLQRGIRDGEVRTDIDLDELRNWAVEQNHLMSVRGLEEHEVRVWVRNFVLPAFRPGVSQDVQVGPRLAGAFAELERDLHAAVHIAIARAEDALG